MSAVIEQLNEGSAEVRLERYDAEMLWSLINAVQRVAEKPGAEVIAMFPSDLIRVEGRGESEYVAGDEYAIFIARAASVAGRTSRAGCASQGDSLPLDTDVRGARWRQAIADRLASVWSGSPDTPPPSESLHLALQALLAALSLQPVDGSTVAKRMDGAA